MKGKKPTMPAPGYTWKQTPDLNRIIFETYLGTDLQEIRDRLDHSHQDVMALVEAESESVLFEKKHFPWTGSTSLAAYIIPATSSHYDWAYKLIKRATR